MIEVVLAFGLTLSNGEFRQNIEPCMYAYCAESREEAEEIKRSKTVSFLKQTQKNYFQI